MALLARRSFDPETSSEGAPLCVWLESQSTALNSDHRAITPTTQSGVFSAPALGLENLGTEKPEKPGNRRDVPHFFDHYGGGWPTSAWGI